MPYGARTFLPRPLLRKTESDRLTDSAARLPIAGVQGKSGLVLLLLQQVVVELLFTQSRVFGHQGGCALGGQFRRQQLQQGPGAVIQGRILAPGAGHQQHDLAFLLVGIRADKGQ